MSKIALVHVALLIAGERRIYQPGETLPDLPKHDEQALLESKSIKDSAEESNAARANASEQRKGDKEFQEARQRVQAEVESRKPVDAPDAGSNTGGESTAVVGADGASNRIFKDISELDSTHGNVRVQAAAAPTSPPARKTTPAAKTTGNGRK